MCIWDRQSVILLYSRGKFGETEKVMWIQTGLLPLHLHTTAMMWTGLKKKTKTCVCVYLYPSNLGLTVSSAVVETVTLWRMVSDTETCYYRKSIKNDILVRRWCQRSNANYCIIQAKRRILYQDFTNMSAKINTNVAYTLQIVGRGPLAGHPRGSLSWVYDFVALRWLPQ